MKIALLTLLFILTSSFAGFAQSPPPGPLTEKEYQRINPRSEKGFTYPYYLYLPPGVRESKDKNKIHTILVLPNNTGSVFANGTPPMVKEERSWGGHSFYNIYPTKDGRHVVLSGVEHKFSQNLLTALGREDLIPIAAQPPGKVHAPVKAFLSETFMTRTRDEWDKWFEGRDVCFAPVLDLAEAFQRPHVAAREMLIRDADGNLHIGDPIKFRHEPPRIDTRVPALGEHTEGVLKELEARRAAAK